ncbi:F-box/FBD/LRR-repeat protein At1g78750-like [Rosa rugosa]|uniref:F-box/FBD/LRR-repeat protein At1g78750-like n=1 Tax=Rosa rugosa TaxID=74645 RepID=UPI002B40F761|nr:F-box/FBD/LRR-repeat protein At1g78750-like [Rosa rugosa]
MAEAQLAVDRFSELPPEITHHILAFLPIADVTRVSSLSKRCRGLHLSNPTLNFDSFPSESTLTFDKRLELLNSLDRFLIQRGNNKVKYFSIIWTPEYHFGETEIESHCGLEKSRILGWIQNAVRCNVENLTVFFATFMPTLGDTLQDHGIDFPSCVFLCESLRYLTLDMKCAILEAPSFSTSPSSNLVSLSLRNVTIEDDGGFCKWVSYCCRFIKKLWLERVCGLENITIASSSLESLSVQFPCYFDIDRLVIAGDKIENIDIDWEYDSNKRNNRSLLNISAPNLKYLKWVGNMLNHQHLGEMNCLEQVEISLTSYDVNDLDSVFEQFLCSISSVKVLLLDQVTAKTLFREGFTPAQLSNVWYLLMSTWCSIDDNLVPAMTSLFRAVPNLTTLNVSSSPEFPFHGGGDNVSGFERGYWELQGLDFVSKLEEVTIELTTGSNGFELARYMLGHGGNLKKMFVITTPDQSSLVPEIRRTNRTSNARVVFLVKRKLPPRRV